ncbi:MAG: peptidoglycan DD-metalloendopeptidase family protein [Gammaproteobacteria bacterium]|nr:peptidoglycan DD-metalloendopeptidase family protein [Gammaproteobacteria bacterium]MBT5966623.1 peptidoglycan DD-metalloendopeptidase family protein [Gammaproteobacteria bacterium]MBT6421125.1 peptidoglycan DD-metalloendopeptidase family protein [Gammaproteobacteria bacterium]
MAAGSKDQELRKVQNKIKALADNLTSLGKQKNQANSELKRVEEGYGEISRTLQELNAQVSSKHLRINEIQQEIQLQNGWLFTQKSQLAEQVKTAYALGRQEQLKLLLNQQDINRSSRIMTYYQYFNRARIDKLQRINASLQLLTTLEQEKLHEKQGLASLIAENKLLQEQLALNKKEREQILVRIKKDYQKNRKQLSRLKKNEKQLKSLISRLEEAKQTEVPPKVPLRSFNKLRGKLPWPVKGKVVRSFGSPRSDGKWSGVLIRAKEGSKIKAIAHGQIVFSDWFKGYGLLVIVKHDKNFMSLYAFNQSLYGEVGDWVNAGSTIATLGDSGGRDKAGLYFEIRKKNRPLNPKKWCKK